MALSDCYMLRDVQDFHGETVLNVYFYQDLFFASSAHEVVEAWIAVFLPKVQNVQVNTVHHVLVDAVNLADPANFFEQIIAEDGSSGSQGLPAHSALNFSLRLNSRALRPGSKRYCGVPETAQVDGEITDSTYAGYVEALRVQQSDILISGVLLTFQPIVVKRVLYTVPDSSPERQAYRLPIDDSEFVFGNVIDSLTTNHISHQVSRGNGR